MTAAETSRQITRLRKLADLMLDARLMALRSAASARAASLNRLADLERPVEAIDLPDLTASGVELQYQRWADQRRAEINLTLARQTATLIEARQAATVAFGRSEALRGLSKNRT